MFSYEKGKQLTVLGFLAVLFIEGLFTFLVFLYTLRITGYPYRFVSALDIIEGIIFIGIAGAYAIKFLTKNQLFDFILGGTIGVSGLVSLIGQMDILYLGRAGIILSSLYFLCFAMKSFRTNTILSILLVIGFLYKSFGSLLIFRLFRFIPDNFAILLWNIGLLVCTGLVFLAVNNDRE